MRYLFELCFDGTNYHGWQRQSNVPTVQETLETTLKKTLKHHLICHGCGRTDKGVHASQYYVHFDSTLELNPELITIIEYNLPEDITLKRWLLVDRSFNAQRDALSRSYTFHIHHVKNPLIRHFSTFYAYNQLNHEKLAWCLEVIKGRHDFRAFCKTPDRHRGTSCTILHTGFLETKHGVCIKISANRFLKHMMRILVLIILEIATEQLPKEFLVQHMSNTSPIEPYRLLSPNGLILDAVNYGQYNL